MLANFYTFDGKANQFAWTGNSGGIIDGSNAKIDLIMQGNFNGTNNGGSNLFGGSANNAFLAGSGDNVYLGTGKNDVYLNKNREDKIGVGIYAYDNLIGDSSSGDSSDLAENIDGESADATGEKYYSTTVNGRRPSIVLTKAPKPRKSVRNNNGDIIYNGKVNLKKISGISGDEADGSALGTIDYEKLILGYEDGTVKTAVAG